MTLIIELSKKRELQLFLKNPSKLGFIELGLDAVMVPR